MYLVCTLKLGRVVLYTSYRSHGDAVVTHSPPTSEVRSSNPRPHVGKLVVTYQLSALYSTEP